MKETIYQMSRRLGQMYHQLGIELDFELPLPALMENRTVWQTDVDQFLRKANKQLLNMEARSLTSYEKNDRLLQGELYLRVLIEQLSVELGGLSRQRNTDGELARQKKEDRHSRAPLKTVDDAMVDGEAQIYPFIRQGSQIEVTVDHISDTNFFADISFDLHGVGLFVATYDILHVGKELDVRLVLPGKVLFDLQGTVAWVREPINCAEGVSPGMGLTFNSMKPALKKEIQHFISERSPLLYDVA